MKKLNFGCGSIQPDGWINLDSDRQFKQVRIDNFYSSTTDLNDSSFDMIVAHCSLQMNDWHGLPGVLKELHRILKPEGILRISLPNIERGFIEYVGGNIDWFPNGELDIHERFCAWLTWYSTSKTLLTQGALQRLLHKAGFVQVTNKLDYKHSHFFHEYPSLEKEIVELDTRQNECYFMEARK